MWNIRYDDGSEFSSEDGPAESAPVDGVLTILERRPDGRVEPHHGMEFYWWTGENWIVGNQVDLERWLRREFPALKFGRYAPDSVWLAQWAATLKEQHAWLSQ